MNREQLLNDLRIASVGTSKRELLEQSNAFVFLPENLVTFNGEILTRGPTPLPGIEGVVPAEELLQVLGKLPDEEVEVSIKGEELRIKGKRRSAGITRLSDVHLPFEDVPRPKKSQWVPLPDNVPGTLRQAAYVCGKDETQPRTTEVHITPEVVEACDNFRLFRYSLETGFQSETLIPASSIAALQGIPLGKVAQRGGWVHFRSGKTTISVRCSSGEYPDLSPLLELSDPEKVVLPRNLSDILSRAEVMQDSSYDAAVGITIEEGKLVLRSEKEAGWYQESKGIKYSGRPLRFTVHPKFLAEIVEKTNRVQISEDRLRISSGDAIFVVCLEVV